MQAQIQKWGNSIGVRIPKKIATRLNIGANTIVNLTISNNSLVIDAEISELDRLVDQITASNIHGEILNDDSKVGKESW